MLADGTRATVDAEREPDLFWALRGAGAGNFGVVTSFTFTTRPAAPLTVFYAVWPAEHAVGLVDRWQRWAPAAGDELTAELLLVAVDLPEEPPIVRVFGNTLTGAGAAALALAELTDAAGTRPARSGIRTPDPVAAARYLAGSARWTGDEVGLPCGPFPEPGLQATRSEFFDRPLPVAAVEALADRIGRERTTGEYRELELVPWGGAYRRTPATATAFVHRHPSFLIRHTVQTGPPVTAERRRAARRWLDQSWRTVRPHGTGHVYQGYPDPCLPGWQTAYYGANLARLRDVKTAYDPDNLFAHAQSIPPHPST
ncbi:MAG TPA: BBE domain-containing protein [Actinophytocola sp.]|uniref:FAD-dependent oxidoreductase n=1 Tax=Actinophytocola sp. TaxID=1872138 RepID=UPI002DDD1FE3|nr:BBE domain-containing protein [Actinophytocola sp.]HEV2782631.1 BBE domain-containing protein [Actinophytocola sp.]